MTGADRPDPMPVEPLGRPLDDEVRPPGSKSLTNRALLCAGLAAGRSVLRGALRSDDTEAMAGCLTALGAGIAGHHDTLEVEGLGGAPRVTGVLLDARMSGTASRFIAPASVCGGATVLLDGAPALRARPMADLLDALGRLGVGVRHLGEAGHLPVELTTDGRGVRGGRTSVRGDVSSQFLSGLLMAAPVMAEGLRVELGSPLVSGPYVAMTVGVMRAFGAGVEVHDAVYEVAPGGYRAATLDVEPDASAASYFFAMAALLGGRIRVEGLGTTSPQGDLRFVDVLERMGAKVHRRPAATVVEGIGRLRGVDVDMSEISDTAPTLAVLAPFAEGATTVRGIGFVRGKETDRIAAVVTELRRLGVEVDEHDDGFTVHPGSPHPGVVRTYDDHRMAMSFAVLGLQVPGVAIADPMCVAKTFPGFWEVLDGLRRGGEPDGGGDS